MNKKYVLKKQHNILTLLSKKQTVGTKSYIIYYKTNSNDTKIAISASKKVGNAVVRNYEKRVCREIVSQMVSKVSDIHMLIVIKPEAVNLLFNEKEAQLYYLINKIRRNKGIKKGDKNENQ